MSANLKIGATYVIKNKLSGTVADFNQTDMKWIIEDAGDGLYYIKSAKGVYMNNRIRSLECTARKQAWSIIPDSRDASLLKIIHPTQNQAVDMAQGSPELGTKIILHGIHTNTNQAWDFKLVAEPRKPFDPTYAPAFFLENVSTGSIADISTTDNKSVTGCAKAKTPNQIFFTEEVDQEKSLYYIRSATGLYLSIAGSSPSHTPVIAGSTKQVWEFRVDASDPQVVRIYYPDSDYLLDLTASNPAQGTPIILYPTQTPGFNQQWKVVPAQ